MKLVFWIRIKCQIKQFVPLWNWLWLIYPSRHKEFYTANEDMRITFSAFPKKNHAKVQNAWNLIRWNCRIHFFCNVVIFHHWKYAMKVGDEILQKIEFFVQSNFKCFKLLLDFWEKKQKFHSHYQRNYLEPFRHVHFSLLDHYSFSMCHIDQLWSFVETHDEMISQLNKSIASKTDNHSQCVYCV